MSGKDNETPETGPRKLAIALAEHALKTVIGVVVVGILGWTAL